MMGLGGKWGGGIIARVPGEQKGQRRMLSRQVILWLKVDGGAQLNGKRGRGSICPLVCFNSFRLEYRIC